MEDDLEEEAGENPNLAFWLAQAIQKSNGPAAIVASLILQCNCTQVKISNDN